MERIDRKERPKGYALRDQESAERILAVEAELLKSEGVDPAWPRFQPDSKSKRVKRNNR